MSDISIPTLKNEELEVSGSLQDKTIGVKLEGSSTVFQPDELRSYWKQVHAAALQAEVTRVAVDIGALEFMNSSGFSTLVEWLASILELDKESQYKVHFISNDQHDWQRRSMKAVQGLALDLVTVES